MAVTSSVTWRYCYLFPDTARTNREQEHGLDIFQRVRVNVETEEVCLLYELHRLFWPCHQTRWIRRRYSKRWLITRTKDTYDIHRTMLILGTVQCT